MIKFSHILKGVTVGCFAMLCSQGIYAQSSTKVVTTNKASLQVKNTQPLPAIKPLNVGDQVPDITFHNVLNYKSQTAKLSDFKGKLVILDMWSVFCSSCITGFPKMEELQKEFNDKIQILLVNPHEAKYDSKEKIIETVEKFKTRTGLSLSLPFPIHDSILNLYFPHKSVPHQIWIDGKGKVLAITNPNELSRNNISNYIKGIELKIPIKNDWAFDSNKPLLVEDNGGEGGDFLYRSLFTGCKGELGFSSGVRVDENKDIIRVFKLNKPLFQFISEAYSGIIEGLAINRLIFEVKDSSKYKREPDIKNTYCYELIIPAYSFNTDNMQKYLREDLSRYFNISVKEGKRMKNCLIVTATELLRKAESKYKQSDLDLDKFTQNKFIHNYSVGQVLGFLDNYFDTPLIDETGISSKDIDIDFPDNFDMGNMNAILQVLKNLGFEIKCDEREIEVAVISDRHESNK